MKKNTLGKWVLAGAALALAFACQPKTSTDSSNKDDCSSCGCNSGCSSLAEPTPSAQPAQLESAVSLQETKIEVAEETPMHVIEIADCVEDLVVAETTTTTKTKTQSTDDTSSDDSDQAEDAEDGAETQDVGVKTTTTTSAATAPDVSVVEVPAEVK